jgi:hypothetical protein
MFLTSWPLFSIEKDVCGMQVTWNIYSRRCDKSQGKNTTNKELIGNLR